MNCIVTRITALMLAQTLAVLVIGANCTPLVAEPAPLEQIEFNYPSPPQEAAANYFPIAENGTPRCVVVRSADAPRTMTATAAALAQYLTLVTSACHYEADDPLPPAGLLGPVQIVVKDE